MREYGGVLDEWFSAIVDETRMGEYCIYILMRMELFRRYFFWFHRIVFDLFRS